MATQNPVEPETTPTWDGGGYTKSHYADYVGDIPIWIGKVRFALDAGYKLTTYTDLAGLSHRFDEVGMLPPPPGVDPAWWAVESTTLSQFSQKAADNWRNDDQISAVAGFEVVVKESNALITKVNNAFGLHISVSKTTA